MKLFILTHCAAGENYTPQIFKTSEEAKETLKYTYDSCVAKGDYVFSDELYDTKAEIVYTDDTYDVFQIFEVEVDA